MDITAFDDDGGSNKLPLTEIYQSLPPIPKAVKEQTTIVIKIGGHVLRLAVLILALAGCVATYCMAIAWICLFCVQTKLLFVTAALLRSCLEQAPPTTDLTGLPAVQQAPEIVQHQGANGDKDALVAQIAHRERDVEAQTAASAQEKLDLSAYDDWSTTSEVAQAEVTVAVQEQQTISPDTQHPDVHASSTGLQREALYGVSSTKQPEPNVDSVDHSTPLHAVAIGPSEAQAPLLPPAVTHKAARTLTQVPRQTLSKEEKKAHAQTAWLSSLNAGTSAVRSKTALAQSGTPARTTGFTAAQLAEAANFMRDATRVGDKQTSRPLGSARASGPQTGVTVRTRHAGPDRQSIRLAPSPAQENVRPDSAATLPPHLRKAKEANEIRASTDNAQKVNQTAHESNEQYHATLGQAQTDPAAIAAVGPDNHNELQFAPSSAGSPDAQIIAKNVSSSAHTDGAQPEHLGLSACTVTPEPQMMYPQASESKLDQNDDGAPAQTGVYGLDTLKSLNTTSASISDVDIERAKQVIAFDSPETSLATETAATMVSQQVRREVELPVDSDKAMDVAVSLASRSGPQEVLMTARSTERTAALEQAVEVLNQQAHRKRQSLAEVECVTSEASLAAEPTIMIMHDPAILFVSSQPTAIQEDAVQVPCVQAPADSDSIDLGHAEADTLFSVDHNSRRELSNGSAHSDLLDLDFTSPSPTQSPPRLKSSLAPNAPLSFKPSPHMPPAQTKTSHNVEEHAVVEEANLLDGKAQCEEDQAASNLTSKVDEAQVASSDSAPPNDKKALKERKKLARNALLAAWYEREAARKKVKGTFSLEGMKALEAATIAYNYKRLELQGCMGNGVLNDQDIDCFPILSITDLAVPKHRPSGAEDAYMEQKAAEKASMAGTESSMAAATAGNDPQSSNERDRVHDALLVALNHYDEAIEFFRRPPPQGRKDVRTLQIEGKMRVERAKKNYVGKRAVLEKRFPQDRCLVECFEPDPWLTFKIPDIETSRTRLWR